MEKIKPKNEVENHPDQKFFNRKRSNTISTLKRKNLKLISEINRFTKTNDLPGDQEKHLYRLNKDMGRCANFSLYGWDTEKPDIKYFASVFCGNKNCFVCNYARQKRVRRKYFRWFGENKKLLKVSRGEVAKVVTKTRYRDYFQKKGYKINSEVNYDLMHLTLTVPHYKETGFNGDLYYFQKMADMFHNLRNEAPGWNDLVFGGEYGIETTQTDFNGLHIHIHALLFVNHQTQNRNQLHKLILQEWNRRTVNRNSERKAFDQQAVKGIMKSNRLIDEKFVQAMDPTGCTMINLEVIYSIVKGEKVRVSDFNSPMMLKAIMETIKYHFEPLAFDKKDKSFDLPLLAELMPVIYRKQLYKKFGCLHGEKALNIKEDGTLEDDFQDTNEIVNEDTGEISQKYNFFVCNPAFIFHVEQQENEIVLSNRAKSKLQNISACSTSQAIKQIGDMVKASVKSSTNHKSLTT